MKPILIPFAYDANDRIVPIWDSKRGVDYHCIECGLPLSLKWGLEKRKHFAHKPGSDCSTTGSGGESAIHKHWKLYFSKLETFSLRTFENGVVTEKEYKIMNNRMEVTFKLFNGQVFRPDVVFDLENGRKVAIEVYYRHAKSGEHGRYCKWKDMDAYEMKVNEGGILYVRTLYCQADNLLDEWNRDKELISASKDYPSVFHDIYKKVEKLERKNRFKPDIERYDFKLHSESGKEYPFRSTYKTFCQIISDKYEFTEKVSFSMSRELQKKHNWSERKAKLS